jgi:hypothetical protein
MTKLFKEKNLATELRFVISVMFLLVTAVHAATPVDIYQDMESGNNGDVLTTSILNASGHGTGTWSTLGSMWVSNNNSRQLPGPVTVGGTTYPGTGGTRSWKLNDNLDLTYVQVSLGSSYSHITIACYLTIGPNVNFWNQFDTLYIANGLPFAVLQTSPSYLSTFSSFIKVTSGKTYWVNLHFDGAAGKTYVAAWDPDNGFAQVQNTVSANSPPGSSVGGILRFGRADAHGDNPECTTSTYIDNLIIDYTNAAFPLLPTGGTITDTTPPGDIATVNDGTGADTNSTVSTTQLSANWTASTDEESNISKYWYTIGTTAGGTNTAVWTDNGNVTNVTRSNLSLITGVTYYFTVKAENGVSLQSNPTNSDGQVVTAGTAGTAKPPLNFDSVKTWPNPFTPKSGKLMKFTGLPLNSEIKIYTLSGRLVSSLSGNGGEISWDGKNNNGQPIIPGLYIYVATGGFGDKKTGKIAIIK